MKMKQLWWKILFRFLLIYTIIGGLLFQVPRLAIVNETIPWALFPRPDVGSAWC